MNETKTIAEVLAEYPQGFVVGFDGRIHRIRPTTMKVSDVTDEELEPSFRYMVIECELANETPSL